LQLELFVAKTAGFCFGVAKAIKQTNDLISKETGKIYTLGPNP
jgi:4-hydroxy-3-methylbut-2-enyl diphosphate reductase IspH